MAGLQECTNPPADGVKQHQHLSACMRHLAQQRGMAPTPTRDAFALPCQMADVDASDMRIDLASDGHITWANNLETGRMYWQWPDSVMDLLRPTYPGQLAKIQRNLFNLIALLDPGTLPGLRCALRPPARVTGGPLWCFTFRHGKLSHAGCAGAMTTS